jgi:2-polyprenyl-3-methyl-5-hydroxy-6-metoxy-1,4-benzoquinol methylase
VSALFDYRSIDCPACGVDDTVLMGRRGGAAHRSGAGEECRIVRCRRCALIYPNPFPFPVDLDALYGDPEEYFATHLEGGEKISAREGLIGQLEGFVTGRRLLDVGAGLGETVAAAVRRGWDASGIESSGPFVERALQIAPGRIFHGQIQQAPKELLERPYDAVVLAAVLEHIHEPSAVLSAISAVTKPGGVLFVDVPNEAGLYFQLGNAWMRLNRRDWVVNLAPTFTPYHVFGYSRKSLTALLRRHGFEPEFWRFYPGESLLPLKRSWRGLLEWAGSRAIHAASRGELGTYIECIARRV